MEEYWQSSDKRSEVVSNNLESDSESGRLSRLRRLCYDAQEMIFGSETMALNFGSARDADNDVDTRNSSTIPKDKLNDVDSSVPRTSDLNQDIDSDGDIFLSRFRSLGQLEKELTAQGGLNQMFPSTMTNTTEATAARYAKYYGVYRLSFFCVLFLYIIREEFSVCIATRLIFHLSVSYSILFCLYYINFFDLK
jgi:hypothetical protein